MNVGDEALRFGIVREQTAGNFQFWQGAIEITFDPIIRETFCEVSLTQIRVKPQSFADFGVGAILQFLAGTAEAIKIGQRCAAPGMCQGKSRIERDGLAVERLGRFIIRDGKGGTVIKFSSAQVQHIGARITCGLGLHLHLFLRTQRGIERIGDGAGQFALQGNRVRQGPIVALRPKLVPIVRINQRNVQKHAIALAAQATLENMPHSERSPDRRQIALRVGRITRRTQAANHFQVVDLGQARKNVFFDALDEEVVRRIAAQVPERQHGNRFVLRRRTGGTQNDRQPD